MPAVQDESEFRSIPLRKRLVFFLGGPLANLIAAVPLFAWMNSQQGVSFYGTVIAPFRQVAGACWFLLSLIPGMLGKPEDLSGVVGIVVQGGDLMHAGKLLEVAVSLTVSLAVLNLLPIPVLDGGQIVMSCAEEMFPRLTRLRVPLTVLGMLLLVALMIYANVQDVIRLWG
jgi:membrane-associated protease RseP (regulator of RpoE activity)